MTVIYIVYQFIKKVGKNINILPGKTCKILAFYIISIISYKSLNINIIALKQVHDNMLKEAISRDILTISEVDDLLKMTRRKLVEQKHPYEINSRINGRVITTIREDGKLK